MKELLQEIVCGIYTNQERDILAFQTVTSDSFLVYAAEGDCCSQSWFESINNPENIIGAEIIGLEIKPVVEKDGPGLLAYGITLKTEKGYCDIEYRNENNGYYGGSCELITDYQLVQYSESLFGLKIAKQAELIVLHPWDKPPKYIQQNTAKKE